MIRLLPVILSLCFLSGCISVRSSHGYIIERGETEIIAQVGIDTKDSVIARYGEPTLRPALNDDIWYYVSSQADARAFLLKKTSHRKIVAINFAPDGKVVSLDNYALKDGQQIILAGRETPTRGRRLSFLEQLLGSVGQLPSSGEDPGAGP